MKPANLQNVRLENIKVTPEIDRAIGKQARQQIRKDALNRAADALIRAYAALGTHWTRSQARKYLRSQM